MFDRVELSDDMYFEEKTEIQSRALRVKNNKAKIRNLTKIEHLKNLINGGVKKGETIHIVSMGQFNFFSFLPYFVEKIHYTDRIYITTWTINTENYKILFRLYDEGKIGEIGIITDARFKRIKPDVYSILYHGMKTRNQKLVMVKSHAKVVLIEDRKKADFITIEGSANMTDNMRIEQYVVSNSKKIFNFHKKWIQEILDGKVNQSRN